MKRAALTKRGSGTSSRYERRDRTAEVQDGLGRKPMHLAGRKSWAEKADDTHNSVTAVSRPLQIARRRARRRGQRRRPRRKTVTVQHKNNREGRETTSCRPPRKSSRLLESLQKTRSATSRNPRNGAAILAVPRLNLLCSNQWQPLYSAKLSRGRAAVGRTPAHLRASAERPGP